MRAERFYKLLRKMKLNKSVPKIGENDMVSGTGRAYIDLSTTSELYTTKKTVPAIVVQKRSRSWSVGSSIANRLVSKSGRLVVPTTFNVSESSYAMPSTMSFPVECMSVVWKGRGR
jgi:hypothetical protein